MLVPLLYNTDISTPANPALSTVEFCIVIFDAAWLLTQGGPGEVSSTISVKLYREAFQNSQWSYVAALAIVVMIFVSVAASQAIKPLEQRQEGSA